MLNLKNINVTLGKNTKLQSHVLKNLNLTVASEEFVVVIGGNGAGKSTLFNVISGFLRPDSGKIILDQNVITSTSQNERALFISSVMQDPRIGTMENMTLFENMAFAYKRGSPRTIRPFFSLQRKRFFQEKLALLSMGLEKRLDDLVSHLSGGQRQALSLIMALLIDSKLLLLDEITAALDPKVAKNIMKLANTLIREEKRTCLMITHNMSDAVEYGDRTLVLKEGHFVKEFTKNDKNQLTARDLACVFEEN